MANTKLSSTDQSQILNFIKLGYSQQKIANYYSVSRARINQIAKEHKLRNKDVDIPIMGIPEHDKLNC